MPFELSAGRLSTHALELVTSDYTLSGRGSIGADGSLDLTGEVRFTVDGLQKLIAMASLPIPTGEAPELPPIPTKITGTLRSPIVRPDVSGVSRSSVEALFAGSADGARWVGRTMGEVEGSLEKGVGALRGLAGSPKRHR